MIEEKTESAPSVGHKHHLSFFRQSGWLMIANIAGGVLMWAVHFLAKQMPEQVRAEEYGLFVAFLSVAMCIPAMPLQMVMAHQTAQALATKRERELAGMIRLVWLGTFGLWLVLAIVVFLSQERILSQWEIKNPAGLWVTLGALLFSFWMPLFAGVLQGQQNFFWLGWAMILNGFGRVAIAALAVLALGAYAAGMMTGVLLGLATGVLIAVWQSRSLWRMPSLTFDWRSLFRQAIPPMLGFGAFQFLFTADTMFVKAYIGGDETGFYGSAGTLSRALMWLVGPLAAVMFPRIVHSAAKSEKSNLMGMVLIGTAVLAACGAVGLWVLGPWVVKLVYGENFVKLASTVMPWYAWAMVPLSLANVLLSNLLARSSFRVVPAVVVVAVAYAFALTRFHGSFVTVLQTLGVFSLVLLAVCAWFTWKHKKELENDGLQSVL
jgi:O-antigen/teichoic acid export membrane protein